MKNFTYVAKDTTGKTMKGVMEAEDAQEVLDKIHEQGWFCVSYAEALGGSKKNSFKFKTKGLAFSCRQLAAMMTSGLSIVKALDILYKEEENKGAKEAWLGVYEDVNKGATFTEALDSRRGCFPDFFISMVDAGESSGTLDITMQRLSDYYANSNKLNNKVKSAMMYPIILGILCVVMVIGMFTFIMPQFAGMMEEDEMPALSKALFAFSDFVKARWYILVGAVVVIIVGWIYALKVESVRLWYDRVKIKMPAVGKLMVKIYEGRFARTLSSLYSSGIPMVECLERSSKILNNTYVDKCFIQVVDEVKQGAPLSQSLSRTEIFEGMFCSIIYVGEESGALDDILEKTADYYEEEADAAVERLVGLLEPCMIIFMGLAIGLCLAGIFPMLYGGMAGLENE
ncbi:MAG: type II secretion system F family protein [Oscillospiraceae bacterium]